MENPLARMSQAELAALADRRRVTGFNVAFAAAGAIVLIKLAFRQGTPAFWRFPSTSLIEIAENLHATAQSNGWAPVTPRQIPNLVEGEQNTVGIPIDVLGSRLHVLSDAVIWAALFERDLAQAIRFRTGHAAFLAAWVLEWHRHGSLIDLRKSGASTGAAH